VDLKDIRSPREIDLGIAPPRNRLHVSKCIWRGWAHIHFPVWLLIAAPSLIFLHFSKHLPQTNASTVVGHDTGPLWSILLLSVFLTLLITVLIGPAWLWWSIMAPKWRIWVLRNVDDWPAFEQAAVRDGLIWPRSSIFNLTEIKSSAQKQLEVELVKYRDLHG
jgi:hypothetical protein